MGIFGDFDLEELMGQYPWPDGSSDLLAEDPDWWFVACMDWADDRGPEYAIGYREAAGVVIAHVGATRQDQDTLVYPFLMNWRHYVELQLKVLIELLQRHEERTIDVPKTHKIDHLWRLTRALLECVGSIGTADDLDNVERVLLQLHHLDPTSQGFRYPVDTKGASTLDVKRLHMRRFHEAMEAVANFLDAADGIRDVLDASAEFETEMRAQYGDYDMGD